MTKIEPVYLRDEFQHVVLVLKFTSTRDFNYTIISRGSIIGKGTVTIEYVHEVIKHFKLEVFVPTVAWKILYGDHTKVPLPE